MNRRVCAVAPFEHISEIASLKALLNTQDSKCNDGTDDQQADDGHDPVKITPPSGTVVSNLVDGLHVLGVHLCVKIHVACARQLFSHLWLGHRRQG